MKAREDVSSLALFCRTGEDSQDARGENVLISRFAEATGPRHGEKIADQFHPWRVDDDAVHQGASRLQGVGRIAGVEGVMQCRDPLAVDLGQVRGQCWDQIGCGSRQPLQLSFPGLEAIQLRPEASRREPVSNRIDQVGALPLDTSQFAAMTFGGGPGRGRPLVPFSGELGDEVGHQLGLHQLAAERLADPLLQRFPADGVAVAASALAGMAAPQVVLGAGLEHACWPKT